MVSRCGRLGKRISKRLNDALEKRHCLLSGLLKPVVVAGCSFGSVFALDVDVPVWAQSWDGAQPGAELVESPALEPSVVVDSEWPPRVELSDRLRMPVRLVGRLNHSNLASMRPASLGSFAGAAEPVAEKRADENAEQTKADWDKALKDAGIYYRRHWVDALVGGCLSGLLAWWIIRLAASNEN